MFLRGESVTTPYERKRSLKTAEEFMESLLDPKKTPRVPKEIRKRARMALRHYPGPFEVDMYWKDPRLTQ